MRGMIVQAAEEGEMKYSIAHQDKYSRGQLVLRLLFGAIYIGIPHLVLLLFLNIWSAILGFVTFWVVLFTAHFPKSIFEYQVDLIRWTTRVQATLANLIDGYPAFGLKAVSASVTVDVDFPDRVSRGLVILRVLFGSIYVGIPHGICLLIRYVGTIVVMFIAWWAVLFTGKYPERWHGFVVGTYRWALRITLYLGYFTDQYPPFSGKE